jgi:hypothetical protein
VIDEPSAPAEGVKDTACESDARGFVARNGSWHVVPEILHLIIMYHLRYAEDGSAGILIKRCGKARHGDLCDNEASIEGDSHAMRMTPAEMFEPESAATLPSHVCSFPNNFGLRLGLTVPMHER